MIKISDIAKAANVSPSTATRALRSNGYVDAGKKAVILKTAEEMGYIPNRAAQSLRVSRSNIIGHVLPSSSVNPFFNMIGGALDAAAEKSNYHIMSVIISSSSKKLDDLINEMIGYMVSGIIFTSDTSCENRQIEKILAAGIPVVMIERPSSVAGISRVLIDNAFGSGNAAEHIISRGHRRIAYMGVGKDNPVEEDRLGGFVSALKEHGIRPEQRYIRLCPEYSVEFGYNAAREIFEQDGQPPTCVFAASDILVCGAMQYFYEKKIRVPEDVSVVGYDDSLSGLLSPKITSVSFPYGEIGAKAIGIIDRHYRQEKSQPETVTVRPALDDRGSVRII